MERSAILDTPNFFYDPATRPFFAARRPYRDDTYRLEPDQTLVAGKLVVHNYGHGGAGARPLDWYALFGEPNVESRTGVRPLSSPGAPSWVTETAFGKSVSQGGSAPQDH